VFKKYTIVSKHIEEAFSVDFCTLVPLQAEETKIETIGSCASEFFTRSSNVEVSLVI